MVGYSNFKFGSHQDYTFRSFSYQSCGLTSYMYSVRVTFTSLSFTDTTFISMKSKIGVYH